MTNSEATALNTSTQFVAPLASYFSRGAISAVFASLVLATPLAQAAEPAWWIFSFQETGNQKRLFNAANSSEPKAEAGKKATSGYLAWNPTSGAGTQVFTRVENRTKLAVWSGQNADDFGSAATKPFFQNLEQVGTTVANYEQKSGLGYAEGVSLFGKTNGGNLPKKLSGSTLRWQFGTNFWRPADPTSISGEESVVTQGNLTYRLEKALTSQVTEDEAAYPADTLGRAVSVILAQLTTKGKYSSLMRNETPPQRPSATPTPPTVEQRVAYMVTRRVKLLSLETQTTTNIVLKEIVVRNIGGSREDVWPLQIGENGKTYGNVWERDSGARYQTLVQPRSRRQQHNEYRYVDGVAMTHTVGHLTGAYQTAAVAGEMVSFPTKLSGLHLGLESIGGSKRYFRSEETWTYSLPLTAALGSGQTVIDYLEGNGYRSLFANGGTGSEGQAGYGYGSVTLTSALGSGNQGQLGYGWGVSIDQIIIAPPVGTLTVPITITVAEPVVEIQFVDPNAHLYQHNTGGDLGASVSWANELRPPSLYEQIYGPLTERVTR
jgi:hypothetical protein